MTVWKKVYKAITHVDLAETYFIQRALYDFDRDIIILELKSSKGDLIRQEYIADTAS